MTWLPILIQALEVVIIPGLGLLIAYGANYLRKRSKNETIDKYITMLENTITDCVIATNQTFVQELKENGKFTKEAQAIALQKTYDNVMRILSDEAKKYLAEVYGDLQAKVLESIEASVKANK